MGKTKSVAERLMDFGDYLTNHEFFLVRWIGSFFSFFFGMCIYIGDKIRRKQS